MREHVLLMILSIKKEYLGGAISPGIDIRYKSLTSIILKITLIRKMRNINS